MFSFALDARSAEGLIDPEINRDCALIKMRRVKRYLSPGVVKAKPELEIYIESVRFIGAGCR